ncbi:MAG: hypothetical protein C4527_17930 [Candidatus Omnitrophota bacterium]|jgi:type II secretory ATPase GspE/PulE/Tfp pilus assembly ATPase PilB-like protein|nr:MAG: hypothetical protein C4527_17930 [Candidatus Omnitrophota bacterium]
MIRKQWLLFLFIGLLEPQFLVADIIHLKNGKKIEGIIRDSGGSEVLVETPGGVFSFKRDAVERIEESSEFSNLLSRAKVEDIRENYVQAIELYAEALNQTKSPDQRSSILNQQENAIRKYVERLNSHDVLKQGLEDIQEIEKIKTRISDPTHLALLQSARMKLDTKIVETHLEEAKRQETRKNYLDAIENYNVVLQHYPENPQARNLKEKIVDLYVIWGESQYKRGESRIPEAEKAFQEAIAKDPANSRALYFLGLIEISSKNYQEAERYLSKVDPSILSSYEKRHLDNMRSRVQRELKPPEVREVRRPIYIPPPEPTPEPGTTEKITGWFSGLWTDTKDFFNKLNQGSSDVLPIIMDWVWLLIYVTAVITVFWYIPMKILLNDLPRRKIIYYNWRKIINYTGIFGLIFYFIDRWRREEPRKRCPACNRAIDNPSVFENYDFSKCPFCEKIIKPPFTIPELIQTESIILAKAKSSSRGTLDEADREQMLELLNLLMVHGRQIRASDIHVEPEEDNFVARFRVDGVITESIPIDKALQNFMVSLIKVLCSLNIAEKRMPQDGHFRKVLLGEEINVRVSTIPTRLGEKVVMRLLDQKIATTTLDRLGMREEALAQYRTAITAPHGLILATGPTGSGKTTLQYASLQFINDGTKNIVTVEDPIEYDLDGITQIQHNTATGLTFATALRSILRQDPDIIMVGEIRDIETGTISVNAALTGHLVLSTLHTIDTSTALSRLIDIGVDVKLLSSALLCIVAQRLVRKLCPHCKKHSTPSAKELKRLGGEGIMLEGQPIFRPRGCRECADTGYLGRTGIYEIMAPNREIREMTEKGATTSEIRHASQRAGMKTLREEGIFKIVAGLTSIEEIVRVTTEDVFADETMVEKEIPIDDHRIISLEGKG